MNIHTLRFSFAWIGVGLVIMAAGFIASLVWGTKSITLPEVYGSFTRFDGSESHSIVQAVRFPRACIALAVGACLGASGLIMQTVTRNPLASPEILGINSGAALGVLSGLLIYQESSLGLAFLGALAAAALVFGLGSAGSSGITPVKLTLAGAALTTLLVSITQGILMLHERSLDEMRFWLAGSLAGRDMALFMSVFPYMALGLVAASIMYRRIAMLNLGEDVAKGLGLPTGFIKVFSLALVALMAGCSVTVAGPIGFIGLAVPHIARILVGNESTLVLPFCAIAGAGLLLWADVLARLLLNPQEVAVGIITACIGGPLLVFLVRRRKLS